MKKIISVIALCATIAATAVPALASDTVPTLSGTTINVYNWGEYISDGSDDSLDVNKRFEEVTGIRVNYTNYSTNEDLYTKLKSGGSSYDIIIPSDYMIQRMIAEDMLEKIDFSNIPNYANISEEHKNLYFDPTNEYSVPYNAGTVGLIYNKTMVTEAPDSWNILWDEKYSGKILMINNPRDAFAIAQLTLGIDLNTENADDWRLAAEKLKEQKPLVQAYVMDEVYNKMESGEAALVPYYAGDFLMMKENNDDLEMVYPKEGTNIFVDSICIPKGAQNKAGAEAYINFLLDEQTALANAEYLYYSCPNQKVLQNADYSLADNAYVYPAEDVKKNMQYFHNLPEQTLTLMNDLWDDLKISGINKPLIFITSGVVVAVIAAVIIVRAVKKKKRDEMIDSDK